MPASWPGDPLDADALPPPVAAHLRRFRDQTPGARVVLLRRSFRAVAAPRFFLARTAERGADLREWPLAASEDLLALDLAAAAAGDGGVPVDEPLLLVCTHGRHDRCCARWGNPFYRSLAARVGDAAWQCSHIGGDRFAANLLWLPWGVFYGRLEATDLDRLVAACARREVLLDRYRGRACHPFPVQSAEYFARREWGELAADGLRLLGRRRGEDGRWAVRLAGRDGRVARVEVARRASPYCLAPTCGTRTERPVPLHDLLSFEELAAREQEPP
ncbi:MAG TPA: sucrase ferredoxin [Thermoanaerobaculia bacterium]|nr:sucrase ferredoxin [Thermoanaerobaculia bacterium]